MKIKKQATTAEKLDTNMRAESKKYSYYYNLKNSETEYSYNKFLIKRNVFDCSQLAIRLYSKAKFPVIN